MNICVLANMELLWCQILWIILSHVHLSVSSKLYRSDVYPSTVPRFDIRLDVYTKRPVVSGLVHSLPAKSTLADFRRHLQCAAKEPNLNFNNGMISRMLIAPPNSLHFKAFGSFVEERCYDHWEECLGRIDGYEKGNYNREQSFNSVALWSQTELLRVINNTLYYDWPWGIERFNRTCHDSNPLFMLINATLSRITDMRDSSFFSGGADPALKVSMHVPFFAHCTHEMYADIIAPWYNMWIYSLADYRKIRSAQLNFSEESYQASEDGYKQWADKVPKAALFSSAMRHRVFLYDQARLHPDLIDSVNYYELSRFTFKPWNPLSQEKWKVQDEHRKWPSRENITNFLKLPPGFVAPLYNVTSQHFVEYHPGSYKYVVVPLGKQHTLSTSARIIHVMFFSGAVAILPRTAWTFHFQAQIKPWVHYVPISFTGADLAEKVRWLRDHDDLARQIAENGRNFARSWMRLEDFYCYTAHWLDVMAEIGEKTDIATTKWSPQLYPKSCSPQQFEFPE